MSTAEAISSGDGVSTAHLVAISTTGFTLGLIHVLAGPDHLSALAALAVGTSWRAFMLGFRWGIGHSTGLVVVAIIFIALKGDLDLRALGRYCDSIVGLFMIALGCYGVIAALKMYREKRNKRDPDLYNTSTSSVASESAVSPTHAMQSHSVTMGNAIANSNSNSNIADILSSTPRKDVKSETDDKDGYNTNGNNVDFEMGEDEYYDEELIFGIANSNTATNNSIHNTTGGSPSPKKYYKPMSPGKSIPSNAKNNTSVNAMQTLHPHHPLPHNHNHHHHHDIISLTEACPFLPYIDMHDPTTQRIISFSIGLLHGVAGPGGILGVLPAVEMQNWRLSFLYLGSFILSSTLSMGMFAALYGELTRRLGATAESVELGLSVFSAAMSIIVGTIWLVLSILGKLDGLFH